VQGKIVAFFGIMVNNKYFYIFDFYQMKEYKELKKKIK